jgi:hypothetical protein
MKVLMFSPGFPAEMPYFTRGLAEAGATVLGVGDQPEGMLPEPAKHALSAYLRVPNLWREAELIEQVRRWQRTLGRFGQIDRVECLWEPGMVLAAQLREALGLPGMTVAETLPFRDKGIMKDRLDAAGVRTPHHFRCRTTQGCREAAEQIGYPLVIKPIAGAGSADTHRVESDRELDAVLPQIAHVEEVSVEEYIEGEEYTFDTICSGGHVHFWNIAWYRPKPIIGRNVEWLSPQTVNLRDADVPHLAPGRRLGLQVLNALGFRTGFTHMEWFLTKDGEAVFGEIGARPPGGRSVDLMNYTCDTDVYRGWAEAVTHRRFTQPTHRKYNAIAVFKRAHGQGRIQRIEGLERLLARFGDSIVNIDLLPIGHPRRNWRQTLISDGYLILRHPSLRIAMAMADRVGSDLHLYAG